MSELSELGMKEWIKYGILTYDDRVIGLYYMSKIMALMKKLGVYNI